MIWFLAVVGVLAVFCLFIEIVEGDKKPPGEHSWFKLNKDGLSIHVLIGVSYIFYLTIGGLDPSIAEIGIRRTRLITYDCINYVGMLSTYIQFSSYGWKYHWEHSIIFFDHELKFTTKRWFK